ncbi:hypothetical protein CK203_034253 [Vitis vinifera]|uniref:Uncharacterized protein n=1 Tax=Vitis vinifera TaxID=29760 RepID=A0A438INR8_VITVI|nr:hypothetical protein CK203_034253 [Vitis vinifera]
MDLSTFEYLSVSHVIDLSAPSSPTSQIFDIDDEIAQHDSDDDSSSAFDLGPVDESFTCCRGHEIVDLGTADQLGVEDRVRFISSLPLLPHARPVKQKLRRLHPRWSLQVKERSEATQCRFLSVVEYPWLANVVPVPKKDGKSHAIRIEERRTTYQRAATTLFHDMMHRDVKVYVDDMIVKSEVDQFI